jgi:hypothetical protein
MLIGLNLEESSFIFNLILIILTRYNILNFISFVNKSFNIRKERKTGHHFSFIFVYVLFHVCVEKHKIKKSSCINFSTFLINFN